MNTDAMLKLADLLETVEDTSFNMAEWWSPVPENICGAAACIAGWTVMSNEHTAKHFNTFVGRMRKHGVHLDEVSLNYPFATKAMEVLSINCAESDLLFTDAKQWHCWMVELESDDDIESLGDITPKHAVMVLRGLATGLLKFPLDGSPSDCMCWRCEAAR